MSIKKIKLFNRGYTLAELLVTMAIIGVVAAVVVPSVCDKLVYKKFSQHLLKMHELVQNGMKNIMSTATQKNLETDFVTLDGILVSDVLGNTAPNANSNLIFDENGNALFTRTSFVTGAYSVEVVDYDVYTYDGNPITTIYEDFSTWNKYQFKKYNKGIIVVQPIDERLVDTYISNNTDLSSETVLTRLFIDVNGTEAPNKLGEDVFMFGLANNGQLIPAGSQAYNDNVYDEAITVVDVSQQPIALGDGRGCSAVVIKKGWEIKY